MMQSKENKKQFGAIFTPRALVEEMLDHLPPETWTDPTKTMADVTGCGDGVFLVAIKERLLAAGHGLENVLGRLYGIDIQQWCVDKCRERLDPDNLHSDIVERNIVCADALTYHMRFDGTPPDDETGEDIGF